MKGIAVAGTILVDKLNQITAYPREGELTKIQGVSMSVGGAVPNVGIDLKRLDSDIKVYAIGKVGKDGEAEFIKQKLSGEGVDVSSFTYSKTLGTSFTDVMSIKGGSRTFYTYAGASGDFGIEDVDFNLPVKMLHLGYFLLLDKVDGGDGEKILKKAQSLGIKTSIDLVSENSDRYSLVVPCLKYTDNLIINEVEAGRIAGLDPIPENIKEITLKLKSLGVKERVIVHAPEYGVCLSDEGFSYLPSYSLKEGFIKGSTGAGDAFCAGALIGIYRDLSDKEILELASLGATSALSQIDATSGVKNAEKLKEEYKDFSRRKICL